MSSKSKDSKAHPDSGKAIPWYKPPLPTTLELTQIAALLSGKSVSQDASKLARSAFQVWEACDQQLVNERTIRIIQDGSCEVGAVRLRGVRGEMPESWPCSFDEALRLVMPKKRTKADRYELFRSFLRNLIQTAYQTKGHTKKASGGKSNALSEAKMLNEIEAAFKEFKRLGFPDSNEYQTWLKPFSYWLFTHEAQRMRNQRRIAAKARWGKKGGTGGESKTS